MTSQYTRGRDTEYRCIEELEKEGYRCTRAASSKGDHDVIAVNGQHAIFISCKRGKSVKLCARHLASERVRLAKLPMPENCVQMAWVWLDGKGWYAKKIVDPNDLDLVIAKAYDPMFTKLRDMLFAMLPGEESSVAWTIDQT